MYVQLCNEDPVAPPTKQGSRRGRACLPVRWPTAAVTRETHAIATTATTVTAITITTISAAPPPAVAVVRDGVARLLSAQLIVTLLGARINWLTLTQSLAQWLRQQSSAARTHVPRSSYLTVD